MYFEVRKIEIHKTKSNINLKKQHNDRELKVQTRQTVLTKLIAIVIQLIYFIATLTQLAVTLRS